MADKPESRYSRIQKGKRQLASLSGQEKLSFLSSLIKTVIPYSFKTAEELIDENLSLIETSHSKEAADLLAAKAFLCFMRQSNSKAEEYIIKTQILAKQISSKWAETHALLLKGLIAQARGRRIIERDVYESALRLLSGIRRPEVLLALGTVLAKLGYQRPALALLRRTLKQSESLCEDKNLSDGDRDIQLWIQAETRARIGTIYLSMGEYDKAEEEFDQSLKISTKHELLWQTYKTTLRKARLIIARERYKEADDYLKEIKGLKTEDGRSLEEIDSTAPTFVKNEKIRMYRAQESYGKAMIEIKELLYGESKDIKERAACLRHFMEESVEMFFENLFNLCDCLYHTGKEDLAKRLEAAGSAYKEALSTPGLYKEIDERVVLEMHRKDLTAILSGVFLPESLTYRDRTFDYYPDKGKAIYIRDGKEHSFGIRMYLILLYFKNNQSVCVTAKELKEYLTEQCDIPITVKQIVTYVFRLKKEHGFAQFIIKCKVGWKLLPED